MRVGRKNNNAPHSRAGMSERKSAKWRANLVCPVRVVTLFRLFLSPGTSSIGQDSSKSSAQHDCPGIQADRAGNRTGRRAAGHGIKRAHLPRRHRQAHSRHWPLGSGMGPHTRVRGQSSIAWLRCVSADSCVSPRAMRPGSSGIAATDARSAQLQRPDMMGPLGGRRGRMAGVRGRPAQGRYAARAPGAGATVPTLGPTRGAKGLRPVGWAEF